MKFSSCAKYLKKFLQSIVFTLQKIYLKIYITINIKKKLCVVISKLKP